MTTAGRAPRGEEDRARAPVVARAQLRPVLRVLALRGA
jgi:hypothetical protein